MAPSRASLPQIQRESARALSAGCPWNGGVSKTRVCHLVIDALLVKQVGVTVGDGRSAVAGGEAIAHSQTVASSSSASNPSYFFLGSSLGIILISDRTSRIELALAFGGRPRFRAPAFSPNCARGVAAYDGRRPTMSPSRRLRQRHFRKGIDGMTDDEQKMIETWRRFHVPLAPLHIVGVCR